MKRRTEKGERRTENEESRRDYYKKNFSSIWIAAVLLAAVFFYFAFFDPYRLYYLEQIQLFRFKWDYFAEYLNKPGGFAEYCGAFLTQFFLIPLIGPVVVTLIFALLYFLVVDIFRKFKISGIAWSFLPVLLLVSLHQDYLYKIGYSIGLLICLGYATLGLSIKSVKIRYSFFLIGFLVLYPMTGVFSFLCLIIFILNELFFTRSKSRFIITGVSLLMMLIIPYLSKRFIYYIPLKEAWLIPLTNAGNFYSNITLGLLLLYLPVFLILSRLISIKLKQPVLDLNLGWRNIGTGTVILLIIAGLIGKYTSDSRTERIVKIDYYMQKSEWDKALEQCSQYPEPNRMIVYFTNLCLLKSGHLGDRMFYYNQADASGLSLPWTPNNLVPFFGCEIFYHLGYFNEAYRWAYEAMEMNGQCPRLLKRLIMTSLINGDSKLAEKYLNQLHQSLFYRKWSEHYLNMVKNPELIKQDREISGKRDLLIRDDFFAGSGNSQLELVKLLENHPNNKEVFEYYMAKLLLDKDIATFVKEIGRLKEFGYKEIPQHWEEAILWYIGYSKQNVIPTGYNIRKSTLEKFKSYAYSFSRISGASGSSNVAAQSMKREFGSTYWYYFHFINQYGQ